jgi:hypothetical protein
VLVALTSSSIVCAEVLFTLLSVSTWYGLAFLVLSLAMLQVDGGSLAARPKGGRPLDCRAQGCSGLPVASSSHGRHLRDSALLRAGSASFGSLVIVAGAPRPRWSQAAP